MKKAIKILLPLAVIALLAGLAVLFWDPIVDVLPIDQSGWMEKDGALYYLNPDGDPVTGWQEVGGKRYYLGTDGAMVTGWTEAEGKRYFLDSTGIMRTGWLEEGGKTYYLLSDGALASGWQTIDGSRYYLNDDGTPYTGWIEGETGPLYILPSGKVATGWQEIEGRRYFLNSDGSPYCGWLTTSDGTVYITETGTVATGWTETPEGSYCFDEQGAPLTGWQEHEGSRYYLDGSGRPATGWITEGDQRYYLGENGAAVTGWLEMNNRRYYFDETGAAVTGWLEEGGNKYYLTENGAVRGEYVIDDVKHHFTSTGAYILIVNPWNYLPEDFTVDLVETPGGLVSPECKEALEKMLDDCRAAGFYPRIVSSYRSIADQRANLANMVASYQADGYNYASAYEAATKIVAVPGTSEHHLGLALDIVDSGYPKLNYDQATTRTQIWLMEHCWEYGFILRYPVGTTELTGIIYEPWHYRYVGTELSLEMQELGICLEEYMANLTAEFAALEAETNA